VVEKDVSRPFPCMNSPCGCQDAERCWTNCCCHTPAERMAWAQARGIALPAEHVAQADAMANKPLAKSCCSKPVAGSQREDGVKSIETTVWPVPTDTVPVSREGGSSAESLILLHALACHGAAAKWLAGCVVTPPALLSDYFRLTPFGEFCPAPGPLFFSPADPPPVPPPRHSLA
jgi:hypothetical protein